MTTLVIELPVYAGLSRRFVPVGRALFAGFVCSCVTHPALIYLWPRLFTDYRAYIFSGELLVAAVESVVFYLLARPVPWSRAVGAAFVANAASYGIGRLIAWLW